MTLQLLDSSSFTNVTSLNISGIPQTGTDLSLMLFAKSLGGGVARDVFWFQFAGQTGSKYNSQYFLGNPTFGTVEASSSSNQSQPTNGYIPGPSAGSDNYATIKLELPNYTNSDYHSYLIDSTYSASSQDTYKGFVSGYIDATNAISIVKFASNNLMEGYYYLYSRTAG